MNSCEEECSVIYSPSLPNIPTGGLPQQDRSKNSVVLILCLTLFKMKIEHNESDVI